VFTPNALQAQSNSRVPHSRRTITLQEIARVLGGEICGTEVRAPGPGHSRKDRSLSVCIGRNGDVVCNNFVDPDDWRRYKDHVRQRLGISGREPIICGRHSRPSKTHEHSRRWESIWRESLDPRGTLVETYLVEKRKVGLPDEAANTAIRFHSECPFRGSKTAAMVCLVRNIHSSEPIGIHRTALDSAGNKTEVNGCERAALGQIAGGVIKLSPDNHVETVLAVGEGIESTLSLRKSEFGNGPIWSALNSNGVKEFPLLPGIHSLWIAADNDGPGIRAAKAAKERWWTAGREVFIILSERKDEDLNDSVREFPHD
jgi:putative DNA primase/helicase